jgi:predicted transcriptional regulator
MENAMSREAMQWAFGIRGVDHREWRVLAFLAYKADDTGVGAFSIDELAAAADVSRSTVQRCLRSLQASALVERQMYPGPGKQSRYTLMLNMSRVDTSRVDLAFDTFSPDVSRVDTAFDTLSTQNVSDAVSTNMSTHDTSALVPHVHAREYGSSLREEPTSSLKEKVFTQQEAHTALSARAREVAAFTPSEGIINELLLVRFPYDKLPDALGSYKSHRRSSNEELSDANFRDFAVWYAERILKVTLSANQAQQTLTRPNEHSEIRRHQWVTKEERRER